LAERLGRSEPDLPSIRIPLAHEQHVEQEHTRLTLPERAGIGQLRDQITLLRAQLEALPLAELSELDELDSRARELTELRDRVRGELERLPGPRERRFGRSEDPHIVDRVSLTSALNGSETQLERVLTQRDTLARQLADPAAAREQRDSLTSAMDTLTREHTQLRNEQADRELQQRPRWLRGALGERPTTPAAADRWDDAARILARYRIAYEIPADTPGIGERPPRGPQRDYYDIADRARQQLGREHERQAPGHDIEL